MFLFPSTVSKQSVTSNDGFDDAYGTASNVSCRYEKIEKLIEGKDQQFLTCAWVQFPAGTSIKKTDKITLPDGTATPIISLTHAKTPAGVETCVEVWLGDEIRTGF